MKNTINIYYLVSALFLSAPLLTLAQVEDVTTGGVPIPKNAGPDGTITNIVQNFMYWLLMIVGMLSVISFVISGILYLTAAGNEDQIQKAKRTLVYSIVGVIVSMLGIIVLKAASGLLGGKSITF